MSTDQDWEKWGKHNPYFGVLSDDKFKGRKLNSVLSDEFYRSGQYDIDGLMQFIKTINNGVNPIFDSAVDFGCGVGRLSLPLTKYAKQVVGLDVSPSMLRIANRNIPKGKKLKYKVSDDNLTNLPKKYDLVYSNIALQHIPTERGTKIIDKLLNQLQSGGYAALHITYKHQAPFSKRSIIKIRGKLPAIHYLSNLVRGRNVSTPLMRMHTYDLDKVLEIYRIAGIEDVNIKLTNHGGYLGAMVIGKKK